MPTDVHAILLVPGPKDPHKLLAKGPAGAMPPIEQAPIPWEQHPCIVHCRRVGLSVDVSEPEGVCCECGRKATARALLLAKNFGRGLEVVPEGWDRLSRKLDLSMLPTEEFVVVLLSVLENGAGQIPHGTIVFVDAKGKAVQHD